MYPQSDILSAFTDLQIDPKGTVLIHSPMKAIGAVKNGADTVLDACIECMQAELLIFH